MERKFKLKQHVWCTNQNYKSEVGIIAQYEEDDIDGQSSYMVMLHDKDGNMCFEEFIDSELELVTEEKISDIKPDIIAKADSWDRLGKKIESFYFDENGDEWPDDKYDLTDIGEAAATAYGWL